MSQRRPLNVDPVEVLRTHSSVEAEVVRGLLDAHGIEASVGPGPIITDDRPRLEYSTQFSSNSGPRRPGR